MRIEKDALGELPVPEEAYYGIQTVRCAQNYDVTDHTFNELPHVIRAVAEVKKPRRLPIKKSRLSKLIKPMQSLKPVMRSLQENSPINFPSIFGAAMGQGSI